MYSKILPGGRRVGTGSLQIFFQTRGRSKEISFRNQSSTPLTPEAVEQLLAKPSWSVKSLQSQKQGAAAPATVSQKQLHHLLRLSALQLPKSADEEAKMIVDLESQLHFVQAVQSVDTTGVEPLQSIRDETSEAESENEITLETLRDEIEKEESVGFAGRIVRKTPNVDTGGDKDWDPLAQASNTAGRYIVVDNKTS